MLTYGRMMSYLVQLGGISPAECAKNIIYNGGFYLINRTDLANTRTDVLENTKKTTVSYYYLRIVFLVFSSTSIVCFRIKSDHSWQ